MSATAVKERPKATTAMAATVNRGELLRALASATAIVERRNTIPVLSHVLIEAVGEGLRLTATDLNMQVTLAVPATVEGEGGLTVPAALLLGIVRELPEGAQVSLRLEDARLQVVSGRSRYKLQTINPDEFPVLKAGDMAGAFVIDSAEFVRALDCVAFAQDTDSVVRPQYCGVNVETHEGKLTFVATDGKRIAWATLTAPEEVEISSAVMPTKLVSTLRKLLDEHEGEVRLHFGERRVVAEFGETALQGKLVEGTYPPWRRIIPKGEPKRLLVDSTSLASAVRRASAVAVERTKAVKIELALDKLTVSARSPDHGEAVEEAPCVWDSGDYAFGFNSRFLLDTLSAANAGELQVDFYAGQSPLALFTNPNDASASWLVAPMAV